MSKLSKVIAILVGAVLISVTSASIALLLPKYLKDDAEEVAVKAPPREAAVPVNTPKEKTIEELAESKVNVAIIESNTSLGSGVVITSDGYIITNYHVIEASPEQCYAYFEGDKGAFTKKLLTLVAFNTEYDLALLKLEDNKKHGFIPLGNSDLVKQGQTVVAIGSPQGITNTVSDGIVSGIRNIGGIYYIQTTAPLSEGNSGGALLNTKGELIGINTFKIVDGENLNFAISSNNVQEFFNYAMKNNGKKDLTSANSANAQTVQVPQNTETVASEEDYLIADSSERYLTDADISHYGAWELRLIRNEIYARHGYVFKSQELIEYFNAKDWYAPNPNFKESDLNEVERYNIGFIKSYEDKLKN